MNILILGTSNSILSNGWTTGLRSALPGTRIENHSIGGSPGTQFAWMMGKNFSVYDCVFFDSVPNDEKLGRWVGSSEFLEQILFEMLSTISSQTRLIVMGFCLDTEFGPLSDTFKRRIHLTRLCRGQFLDMRELTRHFGHSIIGPDAPLFESEAHPDRRISRAIGRAIGQALPAFFDDWKGERGTQSFAANFSYIDAIDAPRAGGDVIELKNSLLMVRFVELRESDRIFFDQSGALCIGFYCNRYGSRGSLDVISAERKLNCDIWLDVWPDKLEMKLIPLRNGVKISEIRLSERWVTGASTFRDGSRADYAKSNPRVQVSKFLFWLGSPRSAVPHSSGPEVSLLEQRVVHQLSSALAK